MIDNKIILFKHEEFGEIRMILSILLYTIFSKKTSFLDHHQYSLSFVNIGGDPVA